MPCHRSRLLVLLALVALAPGCPGRSLDLTVNASACNIDDCPTIRFDVGGSETWTGTRPTQPEFTWPVDTFHYYPGVQDEGSELDIKIMCVGDDGCPSCFGEGTTAIFDPLTVDMSPYGN